MQNTLAYVLLNIRKHYKERRGRKPPVVLDGASSGLWFDGWKAGSHRRRVAARTPTVPARSPPLHVAAWQGLAADRVDRSRGGAGRQSVGYVERRGAMGEHLEMAEQASTAGPLILTPTDLIGPPEKPSR